ncbi:MAG: hypothetical protein AB7G37_09070 [Solirubrobacteraceae bacterium]
MDIDPAGPEALGTGMLSVIRARCGELIAARRARPAGDLMSVLAHAEIDGDMLSERANVMGFSLLMAAGNDFTKAAYCSAMRALIEDPGQIRTGSTSCATRSTRPSAPVVGTSAAGPPSPVRS